LLCTLDCTRFQTSVDEDYLASAEKIYFILTIYFTYKINVLAGGDYKHAVFSNLRRCSMVPSDKHFGWNKRLHLLSKKATNEEVYYLETLATDDQTHEMHFWCSTFIYLIFLTP
jgi:hypothetical protein